MGEAEDAETAAKAAAARAQAEAVEATSAANAARASATAAEASRVKADLHASNAGAQNKFQIATFIFAGAWGLLVLAAGLITLCEWCRGKLRAEEVAKVAAHVAWPLVVLVLAIVVAPKVIELLAALVARGFGGRHVTMPPPPPPATAPATNVPPKRDPAEQPK